MSHTNDPDSTTGRQMVEFDLVPEPHDVDVGYVVGDIGSGDLTPMPATPPHVEGAPGFRGTTTTVIDPGPMLALQVVDGGRGNVVLDPIRFADERPTGWLGDRVREVTTINRGDGDDATVDQECVEGIRPRSGVISWIDPSFRYAPQLTQIH